MAVFRATLFALTGFLVCFLFFSPAGSQQIAERKQAWTRSHDAQHFEHTHKADGQSHIEPKIWTDRSEEIPLPETKPTTFSTTGWLRQVKSLDEKDTNVLNSIRRIPDFTPDEIRMKGLLADYVDTGEQHLRDLALRTREFKRAFAFWESMHLVEYQGVLVQQDVIQRLRTMGLSSHDLREAISVYDGFRAYINLFAARLFPWTMKYHADHMALHASFYRGGRGIALTSGDNQASYLLTSIPSFRELGCDLPIEVLYLGDSDLSEENREMLEALPNVITRDISHMVDDEGWTLAGWAAKPFAMLMSSFREVLFIDADALFFVNPESLFEDPQYQETGALFFKDRNLAPQSKRAWLRDILPKPISDHVRKNRLWTGESGHMQESGAMVVDKWKHFVSLLLTTRLNGPDRDSDEDAGKKGVYEMMYGDKETFWLSWEMAADLDYAFYDGEAGTMGVLKKHDDTPEPIRRIKKSKKLDDLLEHVRFQLTEDGDSPQNETIALEKKKVEREPQICSPQLLHLDRDGKPMWFNGWIAKTKMAEMDEQQESPFEIYMKEPRKISKSTTARHPWDIKQDNIVCLESEEYWPFTAAEKHLLADLLASARNVSKAISDYY